ncbi:MAG: hypothetical protein JSR09_08010 [Bacteroidetes bacterium]|nr:hypothetical protein [Bacteroidota bacterium]MBS1649638.1 hypothetical protein [Bacteroidota bacterium]
MKALLTLKQNIAIIGGALVLLSFTVLNSNRATMFGKAFNENKDFTCCKKGQLYVHHYYQQKFFWITTNAGYIDEPIGKLDESGCNIECAD